MEQEADLLKAATHGTFRQPLYDLLIRERLVAEAKAVEQWVDEMPEDEEAVEAEPLKPGPNTSSRPGNAHGTGGFDCGDWSDHRA